MKTVLLFLTLFALSGCSTVCDSYCKKKKDDEGTVIKTEYVVRKAPESAFDIPSYPQKLNLETATQKDVAKWVVESEHRTQVLENNIKALKTFQDAPVEQTSPEKIIEGK